MNNECMFKKQNEMNLIFPGIINCAQPDRKYVSVLSLHGKSFI